MTDLFAYPKTQIFGLTPLGQTAALRRITKKFTDIYRRIRRYPSVSGTDTEIIHRGVPLLNGVAHCCIAPTQSKTQFKTQSKN